MKEATQMSASGSNMQNTVDREKPDQMETDQVVLLEAQLLALQAEISDLQQQRNKSLTDALQNTGKARGRGEVYQEKCSKLRREVEEMEEDLKRQTEMNSLTLSSCTTKTLETSTNGNGVKEKVSLTGFCFDLHFQVEFYLSEDSETCERAVTDVDIVMESPDLQDFTSFVSGVEESRDLLLFFRTLRQYSQICDDRCRTFSHFQEKFPDVVSLPSGCRSEVMNLQNPQNPSIVLLVHWSMCVSSQGEIFPQIELLAKAPETVLQLDTAQILQDAPNAFQCLLRVLGIEAALESLILAIST